MSTPLTQTALSIAAALFDGLWEGALIVGALWLGLRFAPKLGAATRYAVWLCALGALVLIPILTVGLAAQPSQPATDGATTAERGIVAPAPAEPRRIVAPLAAPDPSVIVRQPAPPAASVKARITVPQAVAVAAALVWILVACARAIMLLLDMRALAAVRRNARLWSDAHDYPVFLSERVLVPLAAGFLRPAIILPASLVERLPADAVDTIVIHEVAHLRRCDVWTNALARVAEALVALNPAAWFVMRRLSLEREIACDDWVVARTGTGDALARVLAALAGNAGARMPLAAPSALGSRHSIVERIERLLDSAPRHLRLSPPALGAAFMALALIAFTVQSVSPVLAYAPPQSASVSQGPTTTQLAANCFVPNRGVRLTPRVGPKSEPIEWELDARKFIDQAASKHVTFFKPSDIARFELTVDASGKPRKVVVLSAPRYPGMVEHVTHFLMANTYEPQLRNCVPVASTVKGGGLPFLVRPPYTQSVLAPVYPTGWSAQHKSACKVPVVTHDRSSVVGPNPTTEMLPAFADSMKNISVDTKYHTSVRVHVNDAGAATSAQVVSSSGQPAFDNAALAAARKAAYPLTASTCRPLPAEYLWNTTFGRGTFP